MKRIKILTIILAIILITMVGFFGVYVKNQNRMENRVKDYSYSMNLKGYRSVRLSLSTEKETVIKDAEGKEVTDASDLTDEQLAEKGYVKEEVLKNPDDAKNAENYKKVKRIIEERLNKSNVQGYLVRLDENTGDIIVEIPEDDNTDSVIANMYIAGKFEIIDKDTKEVLMDNSDIKDSRVMYGSNSSTANNAGTSVYLVIDFNQEGKEKLKDITNKYVKVSNSENNTTDQNATTDETANNTESKETEKQITMKVDDQEIMSTSFDEPIETGSIQLSVGSSSTDKKTLDGYVLQASNMANVLKTGNLPLTYEVKGNEYINSNITENTLKVVGYVALGLVVVALVVLMVKFRFIGLLVSLSYIGLASAFLLIIRYTNVLISLEGLFGIGIIFVLNYIFLFKMLSKINQNKNDDIDIKKKLIKDSYKEFFIRIIPISIFVVTFALMKWATINSFGMIMFWGIVLIGLYNCLFTNSLIIISEKKD